jgi:hypothetical protein
MKSKETVHLCECGTHGIAVTRVDWDDDGKFVDVELAVWHMGRHGECTCWQCRLRHIWYIVRHGHPFPDDWIDLDREKARELAEAILGASQ